MPKEEDKSKVGRPALTKEDKTEILRKLEPYLKSGLSINKACTEAQIPKSTVFDYVRKDGEFSEKIKQNQQFLSVMLATAMVRQLHTIVRKQTPAKKGEKPQELTQEDIKFLKWFATHSTITREEFGERRDIGLFDPEAEIQRIASLIDEVSEKQDETSK